MRMVPLENLGGGGGIWDLGLGGCRGQEPETASLFLVLLHMYITDTFILPPYHVHPEPQTLNPALNHQNLLFVGPFSKSHIKVCNESLQESGFWQVKVDHCPRKGFRLSSLLRVEVTHPKPSTFLYPP